MKLTDFYTKHGSKMGYLENSFLQNVYFADYGESGLDLITPEVNIDRNDGSDRKWRIDFVVTTNNKKYAIECDGFNYHSAGMVSRERFNELEEKKNEMVRQGYVTIELSRDQIIGEPYEAIFQLRRTFNSDPDLYHLFLHWNKDKITPHDVQVQALNALDSTRVAGHNRGLVVLATGLGKTYLSIFDSMAISSKSVLFIVHVDHILKQAKNSFEKLLPDRINDMGFFTGSQKDTTGKSIIFSTIQTITKDKNLSKFNPNSFDYVILDESHHSAAPSYKKVVEYFKPKFFLGLTATPDRMDEKSILQFYEDNLVFEMDQAEAIKQGYLAKLNYKGFKDNVDYSNIYYNGFSYDIDDLNKTLMIEERDKAVFAKFKELAGDKKTIGFCVSIEHAEWVTKYFKENGVDAVSIHSKINNQNTASEYQSASEIIEAFERGKHQVAFVVDMLNEGIDIPDVECLLMLRPTESNTILTQQIGRGLRISPNKEELLVLDFIGNYQTAPKILESLGIHNLDDLKKDGSKGIYFYENEGRKVEFQNEVVDIFRFMISRSSREVRESLIDDSWKSYGDYLSKNTETGVNLFWSVGKKNNDLNIHLWALQFFLSNRKKYKTNDEMSKALHDVSSEKYPEHSIEGIRALFFSKLIGLIKSTSPLELSDAYYNIQQLFSKNKTETARAAISNQLEKYYFWNNNFSLVDRHSNSGERRQVNEIFHIYPLFFVYAVIIRLNELGYVKNTLSTFEINTFIALSRDHLELNDVVDRIVKYREYPERYELEKFLKQKSKMDARFYKILKYSKYFSYAPSGIILKEELLSELQVRVESFNKLISGEELIKFDNENQSKYYDMLFSTKDLISYHRGE